MIISEFETIIVCRPIMELRFKGGWAAWLKKFSMEDDGEISRISAMSGHDIARTERKLQKLGLQPPEVTEDSYKYTDYYIYAMEYQPHKLMGLTIGSPPDWLIWHDLSFNINTSAKPTFDFNHGVKIT